MRRAKECAGSTPARYKSRFHALNSCDAHLPETASRMRAMGDAGHIIQCLQRLQEGFATPVRNVAAARRVLDVVVELKSLAPNAETVSEAAEEVSR